MPKSQLLKALSVVKKLQSWIDSHDDLGVTQLAGTAYTNATLEVFIGDVRVWGDENSDEELTFESCRAAFLDHIGTFRPFFSELPDYIERP